MRAFGEPRRKEELCICGLFTWRPVSANTERVKQVRMMTSRRFFTDSITAPTIVLRPARKRAGRKVRRLFPVPRM